MKKMVSLFLATVMVSSGASVVAASPDNQAVAVYPALSQGAAGTTTAAATAPATGTAVDAGTHVGLTTAVVGGVVAVGAIAVAVAAAKNDHAAH